MSDRVLAMLPLLASDPGLHAALRDEDLPVEDLQDEASDGERRLFFAFQEGPDVLGYGGIEILGGRFALVRSVVIARDRRGEGMGTRVVHGLLDHARALGCQDAYLFTTKAVGLGRRCGFRVLPRADAPPAIRACRQGALLCPASAILMTCPL